MGSAAMARKQCLPDHPMEGVAGAFRVPPLRAFVFFPERAAEGSPAGGLDIFDLKDIFLE